MTTPPFSRSTGRILLAQVLGVAIAAGAALGVRAAPLPTKATVTFLKGIGRLQAKSGSVTPLTLGATVQEGETVLTLQNTRAEIKLENGTAVRLGPNTSFTVATMQKTAMGGLHGLFKLAKGRVWFTVAKLTGDSDLQTQTPTVVAAVKGTVYKVDTAADGKTDMEVFDGTVMTGKPNGVLDTAIGANEKLTALPNAAFERGAVDEAEDDKDEWIRWNKSRDKLRIMIILPEKHDNEKATASISENAAIRRFLNNYLFKVVEKEQADKIRDGEKIKAALKGDAAAAAAAGLEVAADLIVVGEASAKYFKSPALGGLISATANLTARAVRADTAEVIAAVPGLSARAVDITDDAAASKALIAAGEKMASEFVDSIITKWRREARKGASLDVTVDGVDYKKIKVITNKLATIEGVRDVASLYLVGRRSLLSVTFAGDTNGLADRIEAADFAGLKVAVVGLSAYKLELEVGGGAPAPAPAPEKKSADDAEVTPAAEPAAPAAATESPAPSSTAQ